jgi:hypothetical protein
MKKIVAMVLFVALGVWFYPNKNEQDQTDIKTTFTYIKKGNQLVWRTPAKESSDQGMDKNEVKKDSPSTDQPLTQKVAKHFSHFLRDGASVSMEELSSPKTPKEMQDYLVSIDLPNGENGEFKARIKKATGEVMLTWDRSSNQRGVLPQRWKKSGYVISYPQ